MGTVDLLVFYRDERLILGYVEPDDLRRFVEGECSTLNWIRRDGSRPTHTLEGDSQTQPDETITHASDGGVLVALAEPTNSAPVEDYLVLPSVIKEPPPKLPPEEEMGRFVPSLAGFANQLRLQASDAGVSSQTLAEIYGGGGRSVEDHLRRIRGFSELLEEIPGGYCYVTSGRPVISPDPSLN